MEIYKTKRPRRLPKNNCTYFYSVQFPRAEKPANQKVLIVPFMGYTYYDVKDFYELQANCGALKKYGIYPDTSCRVKRIDGEEVKAPLNSEIVKEKLLRLTYDFDALNKPVPKDIPKSELSLWFEYEEKRREEEIEDLFVEIPLEKLSEESFFMKIIDQNYEGLAQTIRKDFKKLNKTKKTIGLV